MYSTIITISAAISAVSLLTMAIASIKRCRTKYEYAVFSHTGTLQNEELQAIQEMGWEPVLRVSDCGIIYRRKK